MEPMDTQLLKAARRLHGRVLGLVFGIVAALGLFAATNILVLKGGNEVGPHLGLLSQYFPGYSVTFAGSFVGAAYALAGGFAAGYAVAVIYNIVLSARQRGRDG